MLNDIDMNTYMDWYGRNGWPHEILVAIHQDGKTLNEAIEAYIELPQQEEK